MQGRRVGLCKIALLCYPDWSIQKWQPDVECVLDSEMVKRSSKVLQVKLDIHMFQEIRQSIELVGGARKCAYKCEPVFATEHVCFGCYEPVFATEHVYLGLMHIIQLRIRSI